MAITSDIWSAARAANCSALRPRKLFSARIASNRFASSLSRSSGRGRGLLATLREVELNDARGALVCCQPFAVHLLEQRFFFGRKVHTLAGERDSHPRSAVADFSKLGFRESASAAHQLS